MEIKKLYVYRMKDGNINCSECIAKTFENDERYQAFPPGRLNEFSSVLNVLTVCSLDEKVRMRNEFAKLIIGFPNRHTSLSREDEMKVIEEPELFLFSFHKDDKKAKEKFIEYLNGKKKEKEERIADIEKDIHQIELQIDDLTKQAENGICGE